MLHWYVCRETQDWRIEVVAEFDRLDGASRHLPPGLEYTIYNENELNSFTENGWTVNYEHGAARSAH